MSNRAMPETIVFPNPVPPKVGEAIEIRPGDKRLVHHANVMVDRGQTARLQENNPGDGFGGMELTIESEFFDPDSHLLFWKPGSARAESSSSRVRQDVWSLNASLTSRLCTDGSRWS